MSNILDRFTSIIKANINELLDKAEDPEKMVEQYLREATEELAQVREATAGVMAQETASKRALDENKAEATKYYNLAKKALESGNEGDARTFLAKKQELETTQAGLKKTYDAAHDNADKMRQMHDKLVDDIEQLKSRKEVIKGKAAVAKTQDMVNDMTSGNATAKAESAIAAFDRMEQKADEMLDRSNAKVELTLEPADEAAALEKKYVELGQTASVDDELAKLKADMGIE